VREYNGVSITRVTAELGSRYPATAKFSKKRRELLSVDRSTASSPSDIEETWREDCDVCSDRRAMRV
jgi:hypothetical protein